MADVTSIKTAVGAAIADAGTIKLFEKLEAKDRKIKELEDALRLFVNALHECNSDFDDQIPPLSLDWLTALLQSCKSATVIEAIDADTDDPDSISMMFCAVTTLRDDLKQGLKEAKALLTGGQD